MSERSFDAVRKKIEQDVASNAAVANSVAGTTPPSGRMGVVLSKPGTERVVLDATSFAFMECETCVKGFDKRRYCIVEKGVSATFSNHFITASGDRAHIITKDLFNLMLAVFNGATRQVRSLTADNGVLRQERDMYKLTIDALRKNGIID